MRKIPTLSIPRWGWALCALLLLLAYNLAFTHNFFHLEVRDGHLYGSLVDVVRNGSPVMLLSLGMTLVIATGGIDLSVGAVMAIAGAQAALMVTKGHASLPMVLGESLGIAAILGLWNGFLVAYLGIQPIVATLTLMVSGRGIAQLMTDGQIITFDDAGLKFLGTGYWAMVPFCAWIVVGVLAFLSLVTRRTALGLFIESVGDNPVASRYAGIDVRSIKLFAYALLGICAGLAGLIATGGVTAADSSNVGLNLELDAILAVVIGGTPLTGGRFQLIGSVIGALVIQTLTTTILTQGVSPQATLVVKAVAVIAVCMLQSPQVRAKFGKPRFA